jgi:hypothetical protein
LSTTPTLPVRKSTLYLSISRPCVTNMLPSVRTSQKRLTNDLAAIYQLLPKPRSLQGQRVRYKIQRNYGVGPYSKITPHISSKNFEIHPSIPLRNAMAGPYVYVLTSLPLSIRTFVVSRAWHLENSSHHKNIAWVVSRRPMLKIKRGHSLLLLPIEDRIRPSDCQHGQSRYLRYGRDP